MTKKSKVILASILTIGTLFSVVATSLSWFTLMIKFNTHVTASSITNYYGGGTGTISDPYLIKTPKHIYNLAWLQDLGAYPTKKYFKLDNNIDMKGALKGTTNETGAVPPIGTDARPFVGEFDGNGKTISNLWVSSEVADWKEKPVDISSVNVGLSIGFFGNINIYDSSGTTIAGTAKNFYLENLEVTTKKANSRVGFVAGLSNGNLQSIGVKNPRISLGATNVQVKSDYSLVGEIGPNVKWTDSPNTAVGNLLIDPNDPNQLFSPLGSGTRVVANSITDTAFMLAALTDVTLNGGVNGIRKYNTKVVVNPLSALQTISASSSNSTTVAYNNPAPKLVTDAFYTRATGLGTGSHTVYFNSTKPPTLNAQKTFTSPLSGGLTLSTNVNLTVPTNSVWFRPLRGGVSGLSFFKQNNSGDESISVYHFRRNGTQIIDYGETEFRILKSVGNKTAVYFDFEIPETMVTGGYEFLISTSSNSTFAATTAGFLYLSLSGTDTSSGTISAQMFAVDYVYRLSPSLAFENLTIANYVPKKTLLKFTGLYNGTVNYNMKDQPSYDGKVYYAIKEGNISVLNPINVSAGGVGLLYTPFDTTMFPNRVLV